MYQIAAEILRRIGPKVRWAILRTTQQKIFAGEVRRDMYKRHQEKCSKSNTLQLVCAIHLALTPLTALLMASRAGVIKLIEATAGLLDSVTASATH